MKILSTREMLKNTKREVYVVPAFNIYNLETLAVAIGTAHGLYNGEAELDFDRLKEIRDKA